MRFCLKPWTTAGGGQTTIYVSCLQCRSLQQRRHPNVTYWLTNKFNDTQIIHQKYVSSKSCNKSIQQYTSTKHLSFSPRDLVTSASSSSSLVGNGDDLLQAKRGESVRSWAISFKVFPICCAAWGRRRYWWKSSDHQRMDRQQFVPWFKFRQFIPLFTGFIYDTIYRYRSQVIVWDFGKLQQVGLGLCQVCWLHSQNNWQLRGMK